MTESGELVIRSFRSIFDFERRIYRIDTIRLNPGGVPVRGIIYALCLLALMLFAAQLPLIGSLPDLLPWYLRDLALPGLSAAAMTLIRLEGRDFHLAAMALLVFACSQRRLRALRACGRCGPGSLWLPDQLLLLPDGSDAPLRRMRYRGPGVIAISAPHRLIDAQQQSGRQHRPLQLGRRQEILRIQPRRISGAAARRILEVHSNAGVLCEQFAPRCDRAGYRPSAVRSSAIGSAAPRSRGH